MQSTLVLCAVVAVLAAAASSGVAGQAADNCVAETPVITSFDVITDEIDFSGKTAAPQQLMVHVRSRSEASAVYIRFTAKNGVVLEATDWSRQTLGSAVINVVTHWMTPMDPAGKYTIELMRFTDLAGGVTELTDFSQFGVRDNYDNFQVFHSYPVVTPQLQALVSTDLPSSTVGVQTQDSDAATFTVRTLFGPGVLFGYIAFTYACTSNPSVPALTFTATNGTCAYTDTQTSCVSTVPLLIAKGTRACDYSLQNNVLLADSSIFSMRFKTPIDLNLVASVSPRTLTVRNNFPDTIAPQLSAPVRFTVPNSTYAPGVANTTFAARTVLAWFQTVDTAPAGAAVSGLKSITFTGAFSTGLQTTAVVTSAHLVNASTGLYAYPIQLPQGFPPATWSFTSAITLTDRAQNVYTTSSTAGFTVACGDPVELVEDDRMKGDPALNGIVALMFILLALALLVCFFLLRRQRQKYEFDHNVDIPAVPGTQLPEGDGGADESTREPSQSRGSRHVAPAASPNEQFDRSARDAVAEMAAARAEMEAQRQRDEAAHAAERERAAREAAATAPAAAAAVDTSAVVADPGASVVVDVAAAASAGAGAGPGASPAKPQTADALHAVGEQPDLAIQMGAPASPNTAAAAQAANAAQPDLL